jgi:2-oxoglutarate dehydrogenase E2 component (dihydrolipoamide succinyltransferase)
MINILVPALGESITEAIVATWLKKPGDAVAVDEPIVSLETDKVTVDVPSPVAGVVSQLLAQAGDTVRVGQTIAEVQEGAAAAAGARAEAETAAEAKAHAAAAAEAPAMPAARAEAARSGVDLAAVEGTGRGGRILKEDVQRAAVAPTPAVQPAPAPAPAPAPKPAAPPARAAAGASVASGARERRVKMRPLRKTIAARLVEAQSTAAILTTFNEVDMSAVLQTRKDLQDDFVKAHGMKLGFMSFFVKATVSALKAFEAINAEIAGDEIIYKDHYDIGVAVGGGKGLVVPVVRDADKLGFAQIEQEIARLAALARDNKLQLSDLEGGTFTISNGGIYGSMLSTPILNLPQTGILGLHNIVERPVAIAGKVEIRPIMYLALSYDHRLVDGREAVQFLLHIKREIEDPRRLLFDL